MLVAIPPDGSAAVPKLSMAGAWAAARAPGLALCGVVTLAAVALQAAEQRLFGRAWLESLVLAILVGAVVRTLWTPGGRWRVGIAFGAKTLLEVAVVLLGASVSVASLAAAGPALLIGIAAVVAAALGASYGLGRLLGLHHRMAILVACGNAICGNSAIAAVAPVIRAEGDDVAAAIAFTAVLGVATVLSLPLIGGALGMGALPFGAFAGLTVYAVPQVIAAAAPMGAAAVQFGTLVKLVRVLMLGPVCLGLSLLTRRKTDVGDEDRPRGAAGARFFGSLAVHKLVPWFVLGFLAMVAARALGAFPSATLQPMAAAAALLAVVAMGALGLSTDVRTVAKSSGRVIATGVGSLLMLGAISLWLLRFIGLA